VCELYTEALKEQPVEAWRSELRIVLRTVQELSPETARLSLIPGDTRDMPAEYVFLHVSSELEPLASADRAPFALTAIDAGVRLLGARRGWDDSTFDVCRDHVLAHDFVYTWASPWKSSPDRRHHARGVYRLAADDGWGRVSLQVRPRDGCEVASSPEAVAFCTAAGLRRSASTLRWEGSGLVGMTPYCGLFGDYSGVLVAHASATNGWQFDVQDDVTVREPDAPISELPTVPHLEVSD